MTKKSETIVFFGNERLATGVTTVTPTLKSLVQAGYNVAAVVAHQTPGRSRLTRDLEISQTAQEHNIPLLLPNRLRDIKEQLKKYEALAAVLVAYGKIVPQEIISLFPKGIINIHPSLLPLHRGPTPIESVLLQGATQTGVSLMQLSPQMDAGPVYAQLEVQVEDHDTKQSLANRLIATGSRMLIEHLPYILDETLGATPQDDNQATYDRLLTKNDGVIDWHRPALQLEREIRAYLKWPQSRTEIGSQLVIITQAHVTPQDTTTDQELGKVRIIHGNQLAAQTADGLLVIDRIKPAGKNEMTAAAFIAGYRHLLG